MICTGSAAQRRTSFLGEQTSAEHSSARRSSALDRQAARTDRAASRADRSQLTEADAEPHELTDGGPVLFAAFVIVLMNIVTDVVYSFIDPRVRLG